MHIVLVANGDLPLEQSAQASLRDELASADLLVAVDGGLSHCVELGLWPQVLIGDLDSAPTDLVDQAKERQVEIFAHPTDKDATDLELALDYAVSVGASQLTVAAAFGGRLDHELATIGLLAAPQWQAMSPSATDGNRHVLIVRGERHLALVPGTTLSLLPWHGEASGVTAQGFRWPLQDATLTAGSTHGVSNIASSAEQLVRVDDGVVLAVFEGGAES